MTAQLDHAVTPFPGTCTWNVGQSWHLMAAPGTADGEAPTSTAPATPAAERLFGSLKIGSHSHIPLTDSPDAPTKPAQGPSAQAWTSTILCIHPKHSTANTYLFSQHTIKTLIQHIMTSAALFPYQVLPDLTGLIVQDSILELNWNNSSDKVWHFPHTTSSCTITRGKAKYWLLWHILFTLLSEYTTLSSTSCWRWPPPWLGFKKVSLDSHRNQIQTMHFTEQYLNQGFPECNIILIALFSWAQRTQTRLLGEAPTCSCIITKSLLRK